MTAFAQNTSVSAEKSQAEIKSVIMRYGAQSFAYMEKAENTTIGFQAQGRMIRIEMPTPVPPATQMRYGVDKELTDAQKVQYVELETRRRWRALLLVIKAKLEAVASGIATFEDEFLPYTVMANGQTVGEWAGGQLTDMRVMPKYLLGAKS